MPDYTLRRISEMETRYGGSFKLARAELGVTSFGMHVLDFPPHADRHPEHDHRGDRQEEVYVTLAGSGAIELEGERLPLEPDTIVRVGPTVRRRILAGHQGLRLLALGGVPGEPYDPLELSKPQNLPLAGP
jgi:mannose-6-phosphate isomerase-like protein (cupin superfamily)